MGVNSWSLIAVLASIFAGAVALQCYQCGQYNDGVGSITPCINDTYMHLKECPHRDQVYCIVSKILEFVSGVSKSVKTQSSI